MLKRFSKRDYSSYVTPFDVKMAGTILDSMQFAVTEGYGVLSTVTFVNDNEFTTIKDHKRYIFSVEENIVFNFAVDENPSILDHDEYSKFLAKKLKSPTVPVQVVLVLSVYKGKVDDNQELKWETINRIPDDIYTWKIEDFIIWTPNSPFPASCAAFPPGIFLSEDGEIINENEDDDDEYVNFILPKIESNNADDLLSSIIEYCYDGRHMLSILWDDKVGSYERFDTEIAKKNGNMTLAVSDVLEDAITRNMMIKNMNYQMDTDGKFHLLLMSTTVTEGNSEVDKVEARGWKIEGNDILSMDDKELNSFVAKRYPKEVAEREDIIFCDSWDFPVTRVSEGTKAFMRSQPE